MSIFSSCNTLLFDLDGTLYSSQSGVEDLIKPRMRSVLANILNITENEAQKLLWQFNQDYINESIGLQNLGIDLYQFYEQVYSQISLKNIVPYNELSEILLKFSSKYRICLLTNSSRIHAQRVLKHLNLINAFSLVVGFEDNLFVRKPDMRAFKNLIESKQIIPAETIYFDDSLPNLYSAYRLNYRTVLVSNQIAQPPKFKELHFRVEHDVPEFVSSFTFDLVKYLKENL